MDWSASKTQQSLLRLQQFISSRTRFARAHILLMKSGHNRDIYLLKKGGQSYVARVENKEKDIASSVETEIKTLRFLRTQGITFVPEVLAINRPRTISIETYVGKPVHVCDLTFPQIDILMKQIVMVRNISYHAFVKYCNAHSFTPPRKTSQSDDVQVFGTDRFKKVKTLCPSTKVIRWIGPRLAKSVRAAKNVRGKYTLWWGDISDNVCIGAEGGLFFVDWEFARYASGDTTELIFYRENSAATAKSFAYALGRFALYSGISTKKLSEEITRGSKRTNVNDVIWTAMKWGEHVGTSEEAFYRKLTVKRMKKS